MPEQHADHVLSPCYMTSGGNGGENEPESDFSINTAATKRLVLCYTRRRCRVNTTGFCCRSWGLEDINLR